MKKTIFLAGGCFWGTQKYMDQIKGVCETEVGFANGNTVNPSYEEVCHNNTGHAETVRVIYDDAVLSLPQLLRSPVCRCSVKPGCASLIPGGLQFPACPLHITPEGTLLLLDAAEHRRHIIFNGNCAFDRAHRRLTSYSSENIFARSSKATSIDA